MSKTDLLIKYSGFNPYGFAPALSNTFQGVKYIAAGVAASLVINQLMKKLLKMEPDNEGYQIWALNGCITIGALSSYSYTPAVTSDCNVGIIKLTALTAFSALGFVKTPEMSSIKKPVRLLFGAAAISCAILAIGGLTHKAGKLYPAVAMTVGALFGSYLSLGGQLNSKY